MVMHSSGFEQACAVPVPVKSNRKRADTRAIKVRGGDGIPLMAGTPCLGVHESGEKVDRVERGSLIYYNILNYYKPD
jgi:hypothetical protein